MIESKALATITTYNAPALMGNEEFLRDLPAQLDGINPALLIERVKVPAGGGIAWEVTDADGNTDAVKEIVGIIVDNHPANAMWFSEDMSGDNKSPDCQSIDGKTGSMYGPCEHCEYNQFGTGKNGGKLCKNTIQLFILREGDLFPVLVSVPASSIKAWNTYKASRLLAKGRKPSQVITRLTLEKTENKDKIVFSSIVFAMAGQLSSDVAQAVGLYTDQIKPLTRGAAATMIESSPTGPTGDDAERF